MTAARLGVLAEFDASAEEGRGLGPYFGFVGPTRVAADPRREPLYVTTAERIAGCPWQAFVGRLLRLEAPPDALDALPAAEPRLVGSLVHAALEEIVQRALGRRGARLEEVVGYEPAPIPWPDEAALEVLVAANDEVCADAPLVLLEAMKMEQTVRTQTDAKVIEVRVEAGEMVGPGQTLIILEALADAETAGTSESREPGKSNESTESD